MLTATLAFAGVNIMVKYLKHIPVHELVFFRSLISLVLSSVMIFTLKLPYFGNNKKWLIIRGVFGVAALTMFFYTIQKMPLATATTLQYLSPAFTVILAQLILGERVKHLQWWFMGLAFAGILAMRGLDPDFETKYFLLGLLSAIFSGVAYNAIMKCRGKDHPITVVLYFPLIATPIMGVWCIYEWVKPQGNEWWYILGIGVLTQVAQYSMTQALTIERASLVTPFKYLGAIYAAVFGYLLFDEVLGIWTIIGMITVISALILNSLVGKLRKA